MESVKVELGKDLKDIELHVLADLHIGDAHCDMKKIQAEIDDIAAKPNAYAILNGDLINNATCQSVSDTYGESLSPLEQCEYVSDMLSPIKDRILCGVSGNHEERTYKADGIDLTRLIMRDLGLEDRYSPGGMVVFLRFGTRSRRKGEGRKVTYTIYTTHGTGGGRKAGGKINSLMDLQGIVDTDIYIHSHTHLPAVAKQNYFRVSLTNGSVQEVTKLFVNTNAYLGYGGYGQSHCYTPPSTDSPIIYLSGTKRKITAEL